MPRQTIKDVAEAASVSVATVSAVVNEADWVSDRTRARVQAEINRLGYQPNRVARSLKTRESRTVGVIVSDLTNPFFTEVVRGLQHGLREQGRAIVLCDADHRFDLGDDQFALMREKQVDGFVLIGGAVHQSRLEGHMARDSPAPVVVIERDYDVEGVNTLLVDSEQAGWAATNHLINQGYERIAHISGPVKGPGAQTYGRQQRLDGYQRALREAGRTVDERLIAHGNFRFEGGMAAMKTLLSRAHPDAVFCANDLMALGTIAAARAHGLEVPGDLAVVGFDDIPVARLVHPPLTTMAMPKARLGRAAAELLVERIEQRGEVAPQRKGFEAQLIVRASSLPKTKRP